MTYAPLNPPPLQLTPVMRTVDYMDATLSIGVDYYQRSGFKM